jgi:hypothetical protein
MAWTDELKFTWAEFALAFALAVLVGIFLDKTNWV